MPLPTLPTSTKPFSFSADVSASRSIAASQLAAGMVGLTLPQATLQTIASLTTLGFTNTPGKLLVEIATGSYQVVNYTGISGNNFTGCTGGTGTIAKQGIVLSAYIAGSMRRLVISTLRFGVQAINDAAYITSVCDCGGQRAVQGWAGIYVWKLASIFQRLGCLSFAVDPGGVYALWPGRVGTGVIGITSWVEVDF